MYRGIYYVERRSELLEISFEDTAQWVVNHI